MILQPPPAPEYREFGAHLRYRVRAAVEAGLLGPTAARVSVLAALAASVSPEVLDEATAFARGYAALLAS